MRTRHLRDRPPARTMLLAFAVGVLALHVPHNHARSSLSMKAPVKFEEALDKAPAFCAAIQAGEAADGLGEFVSSSAGARGFFVHYLTGDDYTCADESEAPAALMASLETAGPVVVELMLMNVVMSAATAVAHGRAGNEDAALSSQRTSARARILIDAMWPKLLALRTSYAALCTAVESEFLVEAPPAPVAVDEWVAFIARWGYDEGQLEAVQEALKAVRAAEST